MIGNKPWYRIKNANTFPSVLALEQYDKDAKDDANIKTSNGIASDILV